MADAPEVFTTDETVAHTEAGHGGAATHAEPELLGLAPYQWVSISFIIKAC